MTTLIALLLAASSPTPLIIDTDAGTDDLLAIAYLLARPDVHIEAITVVSGVAHVHPGARNIEHLLQAAGRADIPVYEGSGNTPPGGHAFPEEWRKPADDTFHLPGTPASKPAAIEYLTQRLSRPCEILALGPLTNLAAAVTSRSAVKRIVMMGGAVRVPGNLADGGVRDNPEAEWNIYADPVAAKKVFDSKIPIQLVPLDATNQVPIDSAYLKRFQKDAQTPLGRIAAQILASSAPLIENHIFYAWDPLAAAALTNPGILKSIAMGIEITPRGRTLEVPNRRANVQVPISANAALFQQVFLSAFRVRKSV